MTPEGTVIYAKDSGTIGTLTYEFKVTNLYNKPLSLKLQDATSGTLAGIKDITNTVANPCNFSCETPILIPIGGSCNVKYQSSIPVNNTASTESFENFLLITDCLGFRNDKSMKFGVKVKQRPETGNFIFRNSEW